MTTVTISRELVAEWMTKAEWIGQRNFADSIRAALNAQPEQDVCGTCDGRGVGCPVCAGGDGTGPDVTELAGGELPQQDWKKEPEYVPPLVKWANSLQPAKDLPPLPKPFMELNAEFVPAVYEGWKQQIQDYARAAIAQSKAPEGYALVPVEISDEMLNVAWLAAGGKLNYAEIRYFYSIILALPKPEAPQAPQPGCYK